MERQGHSGSALAPLQWSTSEHVAWRTPIPGLGHSSPIVSGDTVYLTTARWAGYLELARTLCGSALLLGLLLLIPLATAFIARGCGGEATVRRLLGLIGFSLLVALIGICILGGEEFFDFDRGPERAWFAVSLFGIFCLVLTAAYARPRASLFAGLALWAFTAFLACTLPDRATAFSAGWHSAGGAFYLGTLLLPALVGAWLLARSLQAVRPTTSAVLQWLVAGLALVTLVGLTVIIAGQQAAVVAGVSLSRPYMPFLPWWAVTTLAGLLIVMLDWRSHVKVSRVAQWALVTVSVLLLCCGGMAVGELLCAHSQFLSYVVGTPHFIPLLSISPSLGVVTPFIVFLVAGVPAFVLAVRAGLRKASAGELHLPTSARVLLVVLALLFAVYALYLPKGPFFQGSIVAVDRNSGAVQWVSGRIVGLRGALHKDNSCASPTPVTDGKRIYAYFGAAGVLCTDTHGNLQWQNTRLPFRTRWGAATSPILFDGKVIILSESDAGRYVAALDARTGREVWRAQRHQRIHNYTGNCRTPVVETIQGRPTLLVWGFEDLSGYDPTDGRELWSYKVGTFDEFNNPVCTLVSDRQAIYLLGLAGATKLVKDRLGSANPFAWRQALKLGVQCSSPVLCGKLLFAASDDGALVCLDAASGQLIWRERLNRTHYASLIAAGSHIYASDITGRTTIFAAARQYHCLAQNDLNELLEASIAPVDGALYIRTKRWLYCVR